MKRCAAQLAVALGLLISTEAHAELRRLAVVVGANMAPPGRTPLRYAHDDARAVAAVLQEVGEFRPKDIELLLDPEPERVVEAVSRAVAAVTPAEESLVLFYYSGHSDNAALYPGGRELPLASLRQHLDDPRVSVRLGVIDSCRGGAWTGAKGLVEAAPFDVSSVGALRNVGSALIASSSGLEDAHESEALGGSFFTHHFNAGLRGAADENGDARVTLLEAFEYAKALTIRDTALVASTPQHPSYRMNLQGRQDLPLTNLDRGESWMALEQAEGPLQVVHLQSGIVLAELPSGKQATRVALPPGRYLVRRRAAAQTYAKEYRVNAGAITRVAEAELELAGEERLAVKGPNAERWRINYYALGGLGAHDGLGFALSESQHGRYAPGGAPFAGYAAFAVENTGLGLEVSVPGRLALRFGRDSAVEWVPWLGLPYYWVPGPDGDLRFRVAFGLGLDAWAKLDPQTRLGINIGASNAGTDESDRISAWAALGASHRLHDRWTINLGVGYARELYERGQTVSTVAAPGRDLMSIGSVLTNGAFPLPLVSFEVNDALHIGASAQLDYRPEDRSLGYQATIGWVWRFGHIDANIE